MTAVPGKQGNSQGINFTGFIYTSTYETAGNAIIALGRHRDGSVEELEGSPWAAGGSFTKNPFIFFKSFL